MLSPQIRAMSRYRIRFIDHSGRAFGTEEMMCASDTAAIEEASRIHRHGIGKGYEIWDGERLVYRETRA
jgi:hypothetical protein